jgi:hypothetical protein
MAMLIAAEGPLREALRAAFEGGDPRIAPFDHPDLFGTAMGAGAIVYAPSAPADPERMRRVLGATNAPGVTLIVVVRPPGDDFEPEERILRRDGKPFVVLAAPEGSPELGDGLRRALSVGELQGRVVELAAPPPPAPVSAGPPLAEASYRRPARARAAEPPGQPSAPEARGQPPRPRWALPALAIALLLAATAIGVSVLQNGCSSSPVGEPPAASLR